MTTTEQSWSIEVHTAGRLPIPGWECFLGVNDCSLRDIVFYVMVMRRGETAGIIDTGLPIDEGPRRTLDEACKSVDSECYFRDVQLLPAILQKSRVAPEDIDFVLVTQPITYCTGGMVEELMPNAIVYMSNQGLNEFLHENSGHPPRDSYFTERTWQYLYRVILNDRLRAVEDELEVATGVRFASTGGHHPGSGAVLIESADKPGLALVETAFLQENVDNDHPIGIAESASLAREVVRTYRREGFNVLALHEPQFPRLLDEALG